jgi:sugar lactone lactonase YvrE
VEEYLFDEASGDIRFERDAIRIPGDMGTPDGMAMDDEGMLWVAHSGGFGVFRWNPSNGLLLDSVQLPVPNITSCAFVGEELDQLLITTARENLTEKQLALYPESGGLFIASPGVKGLPVYKCRL